MVSKTKLATSAVLAKPPTVMSRVSIDPTVFFAGVRKYAGKLSQPQVDGFNAILDYAYARENITIPQLAYILATAWHETATTMQPIVERGSRKYIEERYDPVLGSTEQRRRRNRILGNTVQGDGWDYRGRGLVQLTFKSNYEKMSQYVGKNLVANPDLLLNLADSVIILVEGMMHGIFTGKALPDYVSATKEDFRNARRVVNGNDADTLIAAYANEFRKALTSAANYIV